MKKILTMVLVLMVSTSFLATATIRRVGFTGSSTAVDGLDYTTFQAAHDASINGDTIQLYPSTQGSGSTFSGGINKRLYIVGPGYFVNSYNMPSSGIINNALQALPGAISSASFTIGIGSTGTIFAGINNLGLTTSNILDSLNNIAVYRCQSVTVNYNNSGVCNNWIISQCAGVSISQSGYDIAFNGNRSITNLRIENSLGVGISYSATNPSTGQPTPQSPVGVNSGQILNCVWASGTTGVESYNSSLRMNNSVFLIQNCISLGSTFTNGSGWLTGASNCVFVNNITSSAGGTSPVASNPGSSGNVFNVSASSNVIFVGMPNNVSNGQTLNSPDAAFQLTSTSLARNAGINPNTGAQTDCGIYGGTNPYKASGIPNIPAFYRLNAASTTASGSTYTITYSVRSNN
jgi:hypothetical protein